MGMLAFVGQGCATGIHQIDHHNIDIVSTPSLMWSSSLASLLELPFSPLISEQAVLDSVRPQFELRSPYKLPISGAQMRGLSH